MSAPTIRTNSIRTDLAVAPITIASLACLQPGIDPVFLTLLSTAHAVRPTDHGWIVGATQAGMAVGALVIWWAGHRLSRGIFVMAALGALIAALATTPHQPTGSLIAIRAAYGLAMGFLYTHSMSDATTGRPNGAYGGVFLLQLILSSLFAFLLPVVADMTSAQIALAALCAVPLLALMLVSLRKSAGWAAAVSTEPASRQRQPVPADGWALAVATFLFICSTMMVWSFTGAMATAARISDNVIGWAIAIGSIVGAITAVSVMRERPVVPLAVTGFLSGLSLLAPIAATRSGDPMLFVGAVILLNIGSTAIIIRGSGAASAQSGDALFRRFVACTHPLGMVAGPVTGSVLTSTMGEQGLPLGAFAAVSAGILVLVLAHMLGQRERDAWAFRPSAGNRISFRSVRNP